MATGIFVFDRCLPEGIVWPFWTGLGVGCLLLCAVLLPGFSWRWRWLFGGIVGLAFFILGGLLVMHQRDSVGYAWEEEAQVYQGIVETVPEVKGKTLRAEVYVEGRHLGGKQWQRVAVSCCRGCRIL